MEVNVLTMKNRQNKQFSMETTSLLVLKLWRPFHKVPCKQDMEQDCLCLGFPQRARIKSLSADGKFREAVPRSRNERRLGEKQEARGSQWEPHCGARPPRTGQLLLQPAMEATHRATEEA